jgi:NNP family nitrate/nitrite transporter-like MFS transporter
LTRTAAQASAAGYRWFILVLAALTFTLVVGMPTMAMPVLFDEIAADLGLNLVQIGAVWGMAPLAGMLVVLIGGLLGDRFGVRRVLTVACLLAGGAGALRGVSDSFVTLAATLFLFGLITSMIPPVVHKTCGVWFSGKSLGMANGVVSMGMAVGFTLGALMSASVLSPALGGWQNVLFVYGATSAVVGLLWATTRDAPVHEEAAVEAVPFRLALSRVVRIGDVWILGLVLVGQMGCVQGMLGYLPLYLRDAGWSAATADGALAAFHATSMVGVMPLALLSDRLRSRRGVLLAAAALTAVGAGLLAFADGPLVWFAVIIAGVVRDGFMAVMMTIIMETEGVGTRYAGTAMGIVLTLARLSAFASPPLGNSLAGTGSGLPFVFWAGLGGLGVVAFVFLRRSDGRRQRLAA